MPPMPKPLPLPLPRGLLAFALAAVLWSPLVGVAAAEEVRRVTLVVQGDQLIAGPRLVKLVRDEVVEMTVVSDRADELHVHGYNLYATLTPGKPATLRLTARRTGRFGFELHNSGASLGVFEIYPK